MSSSYLRHSLVLAAGVVLPVGVAQADVSVQPSVELRAEMSSNAGLDPVTNDDSDNTASIADLAALITILTPRGETIIRPRLKLREDENRSTEPVEAFLDLNSKYRSERGQFDLRASFDRRDTYVAELADAGYDPIDPEDPTTPQTGRNVVGETRERAEVRPTYFYRVSERTTLGAKAFYQTVRYSDEAAFERVDYDFSRADGLIAWAINPRSDIQMGAYVSRYEAKNEVNQTDAVGGLIAFVRRWSETAGTTFELSFEQNDVLFDPLLPEESDSGWGGNITNYWEGEVSVWRLTIGRTFSPTGRGGKSTVDQLRLQYDRDLSARLRFRSAARLLSDESISDAGSNNDRDYGRLELSLEWKMSPTWYIQGGYMYTYQDRVSDPDAADDHRFFVSIGYRGLRPQRR